MSTREEVVIDRQLAAELDAEDKLATFRQRFAMPETIDGHSPVYLCGNSLGLMPLAAAEAVSRELTDWATLAVRGHFETETPWVSYHRLARVGLADLTGAKELEVGVMNTLTVNLHLLMVSFYRPTAERYRIVIERDAFPSDRYAVESQLRWHGFDPADALVEWHGRDDDAYLDTAELDRIVDAHGSTIAMLLLPGVQYYTGQVLDVGALAARARDCGAVCGIDLAHSIGNVPLALHDDGVDFAAFCTYKYLNAGPGAIAGLFVHERHHDSAAVPRLAGWWGNREATRMAMRRDFEPADGVDRWQLSNPPILSLAPVIASLDMFREAGIDALRAKSIRLTGALARLLAERFDGRVRTITPRSPQERGCQLSLVVCDPAADPRRIAHRLAALNVICDWREPDVIRVAPTPLYNSFSDIVEFADRLERAFAES